MLHDDCASPDEVGAARQIPHAYPGIKIELLMTDRFWTCRTARRMLPFAAERPGRKHWSARKSPTCRGPSMRAGHMSSVNGSPRSPEDIKTTASSSSSARLPLLRRRAGCRRRLHRPASRGKQQRSKRAARSEIGRRAGTLARALADLDHDLVRVIGPIPELDYPIYLFTHRDLRKIPRIDAFFEYCLSDCGRC